MLLVPFYICKADIVLYRSLNFGVHMGIIKHATINSDMLVVTESIFHMYTFTFVSDTIATSGIKFNK